jgi:hypothetical protein
LNTGVDYFFKEHKKIVVDAFSKHFSERVNPESWGKLNLDELKEIKNLNEVKFLLENYEETVLSAFEFFCHHHIFLSTFQKFSSLTGYTEKLALKF